MARDPKDDPYYNPDFSPEVNEVTNDFTYKKFAEKQITGDAVIIRKRDNLGDFDVLLIKRKRGPHQGGFALPGGIYEEGMDTLEDFIGREALEEVGLQESDIVSSFDLEPKLNRFDWDARAGKGVDVYGKVFIVDGNFVPLAADDALSAQFVNINDIVSGKVELAFGHAEWIKDSYGRGKAANITVGKGRDDYMKMSDIVEQNKKRNQDFILEVNKKRQFDNFNIIDLTLDSEFDISVPDDVGDLFSNNSRAQQTGAMDALSNALPDNLDETDLSDEDKKMIENYRKEKAEFDRLVQESETEITDPPDDLADGDAMTEEFLDDSPDIDRDEILREIEDVDNMPGSDPGSLGGIDPNVDIPDDISEIEQSSIFDEYRKQDPDFDEFMNLIEAEDTQIFGADDRAESIIDNASSALTPDEQSQFLDLVDQYNNIADQLPIEQRVRNRLRNKMAKLAAQLTSPSGVLDLVDVWETVVFGMGIMVAAAPEIKKTADYYFKSMGKSILNFYGMPSSSIEREDVNWEHISNTMDVVEYLSPTDRLIKMLPDKQDSKYVSNYLPGFQAPQSNPDDIGQTFINTMVNMNKNKANSENQPDKLKETFIYGSTK